MKNTVVKTLVSAAIALGFVASVQATPINGAITFNGTVTMNGTADTATAVTGWFGNGGVGLPTVASTFGSFASVPINSQVTFATPWAFNSGTVSPFWQVGGFTFDLTSSAIYSQGGGFLDVRGTGTVSGNGYDATAGSWRFTTQDPAAGVLFSFSAASSAPDGGTTAILLGAALSGLALLRRKLA